MMKKKLNVIIIILILVIVTCALLLIRERVIYYKTIEEIKETKIPVLTESPAVSDELKKLRSEYNNNDIKGIIYIQDTLNVLFTKYTDNDYYLKHALNKKKSVLGTPFLDYRHDENSKQLNIYGHNSTKYNPPFKSLEKYIQEDYYKSHNIINLYFDNEKRSYEIFSVLIANKDSSEEHMQFDYSNNKEWLEHFKRLKNSSLYETNVELLESDNILILQTCIYGEYKGKLLVIAAKEI